MVQEDKGAKGSTYTALGYQQCEYVSHPTRRGEKLYEVISDLQYRENVHDYMYIILTLIFTERQQYDNLEEYAQ